MGSRATHVITVTIVAQIPNVFLSTGRAAGEMVKNLEPEPEYQIWLYLLLAVTLGELSYLYASDFSSIDWDSYYNLFYGVAVNTN